MSTVSIYIAYMACTEPLGGLNGLMPENMCFSRHCRGKLLALELRTARLHKRNERLQFAKSCPLKNPCVYRHLSHLRAGAELSGQQV